MNTTPVTVINKFEVPTKEAERFASEWESDKEFFRSQSGFLGGTLYRNLDAEAQFLFVNVARWESEEALMAARSVLEKQQAKQGISRLSDWSSRGIKAHIATYRDEVRY